MRSSRFPIARRQLLVGALSVVPAMKVGLPRALAQILPEGNTPLWEVEMRDRDKKIDEIAVLGDGSFALSLFGTEDFSGRVVTRHDAQGNLLWRAELDEYEIVSVMRAIVPAVGNSRPGLYVSSGFRKLWRLEADGSQQWERDLFDHVGMYCQQAMVAHPSGGVVVGGIASRPTETYMDCQNCAVVRLAEDGSPQWTWWRDHAWHAFATTIAITGQGTVIAHMMSYNPATGSQGDHCRGPLRPQWTVWIDPDGRTIQVTPWPDDRRAEAMTLDRAGRLVFYGRTLPERRHFFRVCDAETGTVLREHVFGEPEPDDWYLPGPRVLNVSKRGVSVLHATGCHESEIPWGTSIHTLTPEGSIESLHFGGHCGGTDTAVMFPDGTAFLVCLGHSGLRIPLP
ncbi:MAG: hypothetical protein AB7P12_10935 [Alphaproteobacteria bacterium]